MSSRISGLSVSMRLMLVNAAILIFTLVFTSVLTVVGIYFTIHHQAGMELKTSMEHVLASMRRSAELPAEDLPKPISRERREQLLKENPDWLPSPRFVPLLFRDKAIIPGVVLRIKDDAGRMVFNSAAQFPEFEDIERHRASSQPFWVEPGVTLAVMDNFHIYYDAVSVDWRGDGYTLYFIRMVTAERHFLSTLGKGLIAANIIGLMVALAACYYVSRRALRPISTITKAAREIEVEDLGQRIALPKVRDELYELIVTINHMLDRIEEGFEQQRRFVSDASHELRTPVTVVLGYSDMMKRWGRDDESIIDEGLEAIRSEAINMKALIEKLLFLARADQKRQVLKKEPLDMKEMIGDIAKKAAVAEKGHEFTLAANDAGIVIGDDVTLRQMLRVFLENAFKYTPEGGSVTLASRREGDALHVTVSDTGIGIAPADQEKVFDRFYRADTSRTKKGDTGGSGLGLSIARWIADAHGIAITLESEPGAGTTFHLTIPSTDE